MRPVLALSPRTPTAIIAISITARLPLPNLTITILYMFKQLSPTCCRLSSAIALLKPRTLLFVASSNLKYLT